MLILVVTRSRYIDVFLVFVFILQVHVYLLENKYTKDYFHTKH